MGSSIVSILKSGIDNLNQAEFLNSIAKDYYRAGETQKALDLYNEAFSLSRVREQQVVSAASLFEIAQIERDLGNFNNARTSIEEAIQISESLRAKITAQEVRTTYYSTVKRYFDFYIDLLMQALNHSRKKALTRLRCRRARKHAHAVCLIY
jgi:tetratricopeptide (TPR) repeat protein